MGYDKDSHTQEIKRTDFDEVILIYRCPERNLIRHQSR